MKKYEMNVKGNAMRINLNHKDVETMDKAVDILREMSEVVKMHHPEFAENTTYYNDGWATTYHEINKAIETLLVFAVESEIVVM